MDHPVTYEILINNTDSAFPMYVESLMDQVNAEGPKDMLSQLSTRIIAAGAHEHLNYSRTYTQVGTYQNTVSLQMSPYVESSSPALIEQITPHYTLSLTASAIVYVSSPAVATPTPSTPTPSNNSGTVEQFPFTLTVEGPGSALPLGNASFSSGSVVVMNITPAMGAHFVGWFGPNGAEVTDNRIYMTGAKVLIARFESDTVVIVPTSPPLAIPTPAPTSTPSPTPIATPAPGSSEPIEPIPTPEIPQGTPILAATGGIPAEGFVALGALLTSAGLLLMRRRKTKL